MDENAHSLSALFGFPLEYTTLDLCECWTICFFTTVFGMKYEKTGEEGLPVDIDLKVGDISSSLESYREVLAMTNAPFVRKMVNGGPPNMFTHRWWRGQKEADRLEYASKILVHRSSPDQVRMMDRRISQAADGAQQTGGHTISSRNRF